MSVEITFPLEFIVAGMPVSQQVKRSKSREDWKERVRNASYAALPEGHFVSVALVAVTLLYFPDGPMQGDLDNIVKPILDALCRHVYRDDRQVERIWVQKFEPARDVPFDNPSQTLAGALFGPKPLLYVRVEADAAQGSAQWPQASRLGTTL